MPFIQRRAYFEFSGKTHLTITTTLRQKAFQLDEDCMIDLVSLKKIKGTSWVITGAPSNFFAVFEWDEASDCYIGEVVGRINSQGIEVLENSRGDPLQIDWTKENNRQLVRFKAWYD